MTDAADPPESDDTPRIRALDDRTVQRIAAGEVVERPASVVKELLENSLDAGASRVAVSVERGGREGVRVRDDGHGIPREELPAAVAEHATSKIADIDDLERGVDSLGFRGEALHTIGAVSRMTVRSRPPEADVGAELTVEGGDVGDVEPAGCPVGTTVEVEDLFFNTPARRKFLKTDATEFDHVNRVVTHYALANPDVAITLEHDGREVFATEGSGDRRAAVLAVYGREVAESMVEVEWPLEGDDVDGERGTEAGSDGDGVGSDDGNRAGTDDDEAGADDDGDDGRPGPVEAVHGLVSHPETTRSSREYLSTFVNGRYVTAGALREAVVDAYGGQLAADRYPFAVLFVEVPPDAVDVNVHPRKTEVRFDDEPAVKRAVREAVRTALVDHGLVRTGAPRGRSAPEETPVRPGDDGVGGGATNDAGPAPGRSRSDRTPTPVEEGDDGGAEGNERDRDAGMGPGEAADGASDAGRPGKPAIDEPRRAESEAQRTVDDGAEDVIDDVDADAGEGMTDADAGGEPHPHPGGDDGDRRSHPTPRRWQGDAPDVDAPAQGSLSGGVADLDRSFEHLPDMRVLGQLHDTYLVCETADGLVLVDQHAADERVNYERLRAEVRGDTPTQALAEPVELELTAREAALFEEYDEALARVGFHASRTGERTVEVRTVPAVFDATLEPDLLRDVLSAFVADEREGRETVDAVADDLLADLACYPAVTGNTALREGSALSLLEALDDCENPYACPHGRPVLVAVDADEIAERFERDYPGHEGRREP